MSPIEKYDTLFTSKISDNIKHFMIIQYDIKFEIFDNKSSTCSQ